MTSERWRAEGALVLTLFGAYAYFFQGGGWNQNGRIAQARALVEQHTFAINDYIVYRIVDEPRGGGRLARDPVPPGTPWREIEPRVNTADVSAGGGYYYPVKPPGAALFAALVYAPLYAVERLLSADPDAWSTLLVNSYLTTAGSVGLAGALTALLVWKVSRSLYPGLPAAAHLGAALSLGLGTLMLPFSTMLFDHVLSTFWGMLAFACLLTAYPARERLLRSAAAGAAAGIGVLTNYTLVIVAFLLLAYLASLRRFRGAVAFSIGMLPPLIALALYQWSAFGAPWVLGYAVQNEIFVDRSRILGMFAAPDPALMAAVLFSAQRGLFYSSPVLLCAFAGLWLAARSGRAREAALALGVFASFLLLNGAFLHWHGSWSIGPRHLMPALPFLALGLAPAFARLPRLTGALAVASTLLLLLATAVDPQPSPRITNPIFGYAWPLFRGDALRVYRVEMRGPVSANPIGVCEGWFHTLYPAGSREARLNSFNLGELLFPESRKSLLPLLLWLGAGVAATLRYGRAAVRGG